MKKIFTDFSNEQSLKIGLAFVVGFLQFYSAVFLTKYFDYSLVNEYSLIVFSIQQVLILFLNIFFQKKVFLKLEYFAVVAVLAILLLSKASFGWSPYLIGTAFFSISFFLQYSLVKLFKESGDKINFAYSAEMLGGLAGVISWYYFSSSLGFYGFALLSILIFISLAAVNFKKNLALLYAICILPVLFFIGEPDPVFNKRDNQQIVSSGKKLNKIWDPNGTIEVVEASDALTFILFEGGSLRSHINKFDGDYRKLRQNYEQGIPLHLWGLDVAASHFLVAKSGYSAALISAVGGQEILAAKAFGASEITAIDINKSAQIQVSQNFKDYTGDVYQNVNIANIDGRRFIQHSDKSYDLIQIYSAFNASYSSSLGSQFLQSSLMTVEALKDYESRLAENGILHITQSGYYKNKAGFLKAFGEDLLNSKKIIIFKKDDFKEGLITFLYKKNIWTEFELKKLEDWLLTDTTAKWKFIVHPYKQITEPDSKNKENQHYLNRASTDDQPFFKLVEPPMSFLQVKILFLVLISLLMVFFYLQSKKNNFAKVSRILFLMGITFATTQSILVVKFQQYLGNPAKGLSFALASLFIILFVSLFGRKINLSNIANKIIVLAFCVSLFFVATSHNAEVVSLALILILLALSFLQSCLFQRILFGFRNEVVWLLMLNGLGLAVGLTLFHLVYIYLGFAAVIVLTGLAYLLLNLIKTNFSY